MGYPKNKFYQGVFNPINKQKYGGSKNPVYRSGLERDFFIWLDNNPSVIAWSSENIKIPYYSELDKKFHHYYVDLIAAFKTPKGEIKKFLIEIKPKSQISPPKDSNRKKQQTMLYEKLMFAKNQFKWKAAKEYAEKNGMEFIIFTDEFLKKLKNRD